MQHPPKIVFALLLSLLVAPSAAAKGKFVLVVHGGAGVIENKPENAKQLAASRAKLAEALKSGHAILKRGGSSLDAVVAAIVVLEDSPLFNAGKGAVFTSRTTHELDAAIMDGRQRRAGAVGAVKGIKNPIRLARRVMERSPHVLLVGRGAETFARKQGFSRVSARYFYTKRRHEQLQRAKKKRRVGRGASLQRPRAVHYGTVGAVALDQAGNLAAATSTGGLTNKRFGRVGDSPIIGAGTYADNRSCAVSCTGQGEYFMRAMAAHSVAARVRLGKRGLQQAARETIEQEVGVLGGKGGLIAVDAKGKVAMVFNSKGMFRGVIDAAGEVQVKIFR